MRKENKIAKKENHDRSRRQPYDQSFLIPLIGMLMILFRLILKEQCTVKGWGVGVRVYCTCYLLCHVLLCYCIPRLLVASSLGHGRCPGPDPPIPDSIAGINVPVDEVESVHYSLQDRSHDEARCIVCVCVCMCARQSRCAKEGIPRSEWLVGVKS